MGEGTSSIRRSSVEIGFKLTLVFVLLFGLSVMPSPFPETIPRELSLRSWVTKVSRAKGKEGLRARADRVSNSSFFLGSGGGVVSLDILEAIEGKAGADLFMRSIYRSSPSERESPTSLSYVSFVFPSSLPRSVPSTLTRPMCLIS